MTVVAPAVPAIGAVAYWMAGRRSGGWLRIPITFYTAVAVAMLAEWCSSQLQSTDSVLADVVFATVLGAGAIVGVVLFVAAARVVGNVAVDRWRGRLGRCRRCAYDLTGNASGRCPECGTPCPITPAPRAKTGLATDAHG